MIFARYGTHLHDAVESSGDDSGLLGAGFHVEQSRALLSWVEE